MRMARGKKEKREKRKRGGEGEGRWIEEGLNSLFLHAVCVCVCLCVCVVGGGLDCADMNHSERFKRFHDTAGHRSRSFYKV